MSLIISNILSDNVHGMYCVCAFAFCNPHCSSQIYSFSLLVTFLNVTRIIILVRWLIKLIMRCSSQYMAPCCFIETMIIILSYENIFQEIIRCCRCHSVIFVITSTPNSPTAFICLLVMLTSPDALLFFICCTAVSTATTVAKLLCTHFVIQSRNKNHAGRI